MTISPISLENVIINASEQHTKNSTNFTWPFHDFFFELKIEVEILYRNFLKYFLFFFLFSNKCNSTKYHHIESITFKCEAESVGILKKNG